MSDFIHLKSIMNLKCQPGAYGIHDLWLDSRLTQARFFALSEAEGRLRPIPSALVRIKVNAEGADICRSLEEIRTYECVASPEVLTPDLEVQLYAQAGLKPAWVDDDSPPMNYTSMIQSIDAGQKPQHQSAASWIGRRIESSTGTLGNVTDLVFSLNDWSLRYLVVEDCQQKDRFVLVDPEWIEPSETGTDDLVLGLSREILLLEAVFDPRSDQKRRYQIDV